IAIVFGDPLFCPFFFPFLPLFFLSSSLPLCFSLLLYFGPWFTNHAELRWARHNPLLFYLCSLGFVDVRFRTNKHSACHTPPAPLIEQSLIFFSLLGPEQGSACMQRCLNPGPSGIRTAP
ncbi:unnamed protein product, partial [Discosporangium mesarthrocarpum]